jgi:tetratricopeptide (TPR) repeat protein
MSAHAPLEDLASLIEKLLAWPANRRVAWVAAQRPGLRLIEALKQYADQRLHSNPSAAGAASSCALELAGQMPDEPLALPLAAWIRGNWAAYHDPQAAIQWYQQAVVGYRAAGDRLSTARLLSNLVFAYSDSGRFPESQAAYQEARALLTPLEQGTTIYLQALEQNYGWLLHNRGEYDAALVVHERALALARQLDRPELVAEVQVNRVLALAMLGRLAEGEAALLQERAVAEQHQRALTVARIDMNLGELYAALGRPAEALRRLQAARERFMALGNAMEVGSVLLREAMLFERIGSLREACRSYAEAHTHFTALQMWPQVGTALIRHAAARRQHGDFVRAAALLAEAEALWQQLDQPLWRTQALLERAALALAQSQVATALELLLAPLPIAGNPALEARRDMLLGEALTLHWRTSGALDAREQARSGYELALTYARNDGDRWMERQSLEGLGRLMLPDDPAAAQDYLEAAATHDDLIRQSLSVEELKAAFQAQSSDLLPLLARLAIDQGQPSAALAYTWRAKGSALRDLLRAPAVEGALPPAEQAELEQLRQQLAGRRWQAALEATPDTPENVRERSDPAIRALEQRLYDLRRRRNRLLATEDSAELTDPTRLLRDIEADLLIEYLRCDEMLVALCSGRDGQCRAVILAPVEAILDLLDELWLNIQNVLAQPAERRIHSRRDWLDECHPLLQRCYELLIAPLGDLPLGTSDDARPCRLLIAPDDPLYLFPFAACWDGQRYLIERCEILMTPSAGLLAVRPPTGPTTAPLIIAASAEGRLGDVSTEAAAIRQVLPDSVYLLDDPSALDYLRHLTTAPRLLHIAAHSILREDAPIFSALQLVGGLLSVEQCYDLPLAGTELVTLSACATGTGLDSGGALLAFQSALFVAGARQVLSSLWPIDDQATAAWMGRFYHQLAAGQSAAAALCQTQRALLADVAYGHPAIWAAFTCSRR